MINQIFSQARDWSRRITWLNILQLNCEICETSERYFPIFYLKDNKRNSLHVSWKYDRTLFILCFSEFTRIHVFARNNLKSIFSALNGKLKKGQFARKGKQKLVNQFLGYFAMRRQRDQGRIKGWFLQKRLSIVWTSFSLIYVKSRQCRLLQALFTNSFHNDTNIASASLRNTTERMTQTVV